MKVLIFSANNDFSAIECATMQLNKGNEVFVLSCDSNMKICMHNKLGNSLYCKLCQHTMLSAWKKSGVFDKIHILYAVSIDYQILADNTIEKSCAFD